MTILDIKGLNASVENTQILYDFNLQIEPNQIHVIMGPNGCGKSTLSKVLAGHPAYDVSSGIVKFNATELLTLEPETRSHIGLFLAFQYPIEISGINTSGSTSGFSFAFCFSL